MLLFSDVGQVKLSLNTHHRREKCYVNAVLDDIQRTQDSNHVTKSAINFASKARSISLAMPYVSAINFAMPCLLWTLLERR
jgi:hypothetical protein